jgi:hypothetical protein
MNARFLLPLCLAACRDDACPIEADIAPGCGILLDGEPLRLGDALAGAPAVVDLGATGQRFDLGVVAGFCDEGGGVTSLLLLDGYPGATAGGVGLGSAEGAVEAEFGAATPDPLTGSRWYGALGIGVEVEGGAVARIHVFPPQQGW